MTSSPRSIRFDTATEARLSAFAARHPGLYRSGAAALLVEEGLRMDAHPGIVFREGPAGRRAGLAGGPDVWEVIRAISLTRRDDPTLSGESVLDFVAENTGLSARSLHIAVSYYSAFPAEIDAQIEDAQRAEQEAERVIRQRDELLGV